VIPVVGLTAEEVSANGPTIKPDGSSSAVIWNRDDKQLYAVQTGTIEVQWKSDTSTDPASIVEVEIVWPETDGTGDDENLPSDESVFQTFVAGSPAVPLDIESLLPEGGAVGTQLTEFDAGLQRDTSQTSQPTLEAAVLNDNAFSALLPDAMSRRAFVVISDNGPVVTPATGSLYFQFIRVRATTDPDVMKGTTNAEIGTVIDANSDPSFYGTFHNEAAGAPFTSSASAPVAPESDRYVRFYNRANRTGSIVPVNTRDDDNNGVTDTFALTFYQRGMKLIDARTGSSVLDEDFDPLTFFDWPHATAEYTPVWPATGTAPSIVIAKQDGSREIDEAAFGLDLDIFYENDDSQPAFNPNEEHALIAPFGSGDAVFALRNDLNTDDTSEPFVLMTYYDPNDFDVDGLPRAKMQTFEVFATEGIFDFDGWPDDQDGGLDPYEGSAGAFINAPYPLSLFGYSPQNYFTQGPVFEDKTARHWATAATEGADSGDCIVMKFFYPFQAGFYLPDDYVTQLEGLSEDLLADAGLPSGAYSRSAIESGDVDIPWLDGGLNASAVPAPGTNGCVVDTPLSGEPVDVIFNTVWPDDTPTLQLGEILLEAKFGLPQINGQCSVDFVYPNPNANPAPLQRAKLIDPTFTRSVSLAEIPTDVRTDTNTDGTKSFPDLPPALNFRLSYNEGTRLLSFKGIVVDPVAGFDYVLLNVISEADKARIQYLDGPGDTGSDWDEAINELAEAADSTYDIDDSSEDLFDVLALTTGDSEQLGYVTLAFQDSDDCGALPTSVEIIRIVNTINPGGIAVVNPSCVFEEKLTLTQKNDFGGRPENFEMEWLYLPDEDGTIPDPPPNDQTIDFATTEWAQPPLIDENGVPVDSSGAGLNEITIQGPGLLTLTDNWFVTRYKRIDDDEGSAPDDDALWGDDFSEWTEPMLAPGWIKRVVGQINPFTQRASGGGIEGAEASFASFSDTAPNTLVSMISQAGDRYTGSIPLNCNNLDSFGLIAIYSTVLDRGADLSINSLAPINNPNVNTALLLAASRISDLYVLLGNEAYADAQDPTIAFGTEDGTYGAQATTIHAFMNQTSSLLEEELSLLRGRDATYGPGTQTFPFYNKLVWNFTTDFTGGEVAYALNYNIKDLVDGGDGTISEADAKRLYPQGHGDAWGHYMTALKTYYGLLNHPFYSWANRSEAVLVGGVPVTVDFIDERKFARAAAARARAGAEIVDLTYRDVYEEDPELQWQNYEDSDAERAWGFSDWSSRAGQAAYLDWVVGNAILRAEDPDPDATGILKIDRTTVPELDEIAVNYASIEAKQEQADLALNPLGLGENIIPFDISPTEIDNGFTHFEQIYGRALVTMNNAVTVFNQANGATQLLRQQNDTIEDFERGVLDTEKDFNARLIEIFGYPYPEDIGPGGTYPTGYQGPDLYHFMYKDETGFDRDGVIQAIYFNQGDGDGSDNATDIPALATAAGIDAATASQIDTLLGTVASNGGEVVINDGDITFTVEVTNYMTPSMLSGDQVPSPNTSPGQDNFNLSTQIASSTVLSKNSFPVKYNIRNNGGRFGLTKPAGWTERRAPGKIQVARSNMIQALGNFMRAVDDYGSFVGDIQGEAELLAARYALNAANLDLLEDRLDQQQLLDGFIIALKTISVAINRIATAAERLTEAGATSVPTVTGVIVGFSNGVIIDGLAPVRGGLKIGGIVAAEIARGIADIADLAIFGIEKQQGWEEAQLNIDQTTLQQEFSILEATTALESSLRNEIPLRVALHNAYEAVQQTSGEYLAALAEGQRVLGRLDIFRKQVSADTQAFRYNDMAFRIFRNDVLQKYRAQYDLAQQYVFMAAKAYDYETTMLSTDPLAGSQFLSDIVQQRQIGVVVDGAPQTGVGLAGTLAEMERNFEVLRGQLGFNNPQTETNRFSLRYELERKLPGEAGDQAWRESLGEDYFTADDGSGVVDNLWDVPEFVRYCVPPAEFGDVEPGLIIEFPTYIVEGKNFFGLDAGGLDSSYDSTQFATKIRSVGVWFSNYDFLNLSNTPRVYLIPAGNDVLLSPTGFRSVRREFSVLDQVIPVPFPITTNDVDDPFWVPSVDTLTGAFQPIRRFGRFRAYHDSGEFTPDETIRDSRLIGRSVWNRKWMLIIPESTLGSQDDALETFINGRTTNTEGDRDGNGVSDIKLFFETYAYPRLKKSAPNAVEVEIIVSDGE